MRKFVHSELFQIWKNVSDIVQPSAPATESDNNLLFPQVEWINVNKRFINNIPTPTLQPVLGCSEDPSFYEDVHKRSDYGYHRNLGVKFTKPNPFGAISGYLTDAGVITVPNDVFHGYVYQEGVGWILHAEFGEEKDIQMSTNTKNLMKMKETEIKKRRKRK